MKVVRCRRAVTNLLLVCTVASVPLPLPSVGDAVVYLHGGVCVDGIGVSRSSLQQPDVQSLFKTQLAALSSVTLNRVVSAYHATVSASDVYVVAVAPCGGNTSVTSTETGRRLQTGEQVRRNVYGGDQRGTAREAEALENGAGENRLKEGVR